MNDNPEQCRAAFRGEPIAEITRMKIPGVVVGLALLGLLLATGCQSSKPGSSSHASVEIKGHSAREIQATTTVVFVENGYALRTNTPTRMLFERPASSGEKFRHGDWMNAGMIIQIKVRIQSLPDESYVLRADVFSVQDPTEKAFREESRLVLFSKEPYQKLLDEVSQRLGGPIARPPD